MDKNSKRHKDRAAEHQSRSNEKYSSGMGKGNSGRYLGLILYGLADSSICNFTSNIHPFHQSTVIYLILAFKFLWYAMSRLVFCDHFSWNYYFIFWGFRTLVFIHIWPRFSIKISSIHHLSFLYVIISSPPSPIATNRSSMTNKVSAQGSHSPMGRPSIPAPPS